MANDENLIPMNELTKEQQREIARKGGIASGKARAKKKMLKTLLEEALSKGTETDNNYINITLALIQQANNGNVKAYEVIRDTLGQKPKEQIEISHDTNEIENKIDDYLCKRKQKI